MKFINGYSYTETELFLIPTFIFYKNKNESIKWVCISIRFLSLMAETTIYYGEKNDRCN
jgi:hypothetical protein